MKFLADVNIPQSLINRLVEEGFDVLDVKKQDPFLSDAELINIAKKEQRIILTLDKDFISLTQFPKYQVPTIVVRLRNQHPEKIAEKVSALLKNQEENLLSKSLTVIKEETANSYPY